MGLGSGEDAMASALRSIHHDHSTSSWLINDPDIVDRSTPVPVLTTAFPLIPDLFSPTVMRAV